MPWLETNVYEQRIQFVVEALQPTATMTALCQRYGISRKTGYKWLARYRGAGSLTALTNHSRRPTRSPAVTAESMTARVVALRRQYGWAGRKLQPLLAAEGLPVSTATIDRIIRREGLVDRDEARRPAPQRFTRERPNELWQMDVKGQYPLRRARWCFPLSIVDDHSRYAVGVFALSSTAGAGVHAAVVQCFERYGVPDALLVDHGVPWWNPANGHGLTTVVVALLRQGIDVIYSGVRHPQTQGKVERFHRTLGRRLRQWGVPTTLAGFTAAFDRFRHEYNAVRPHEALALQPPSTRYRRSPRPYQAVPAPWVYPPAWPVERVDRTGSISYGGRRYFVCQALAGEQVGCQVFDRRLLVTFRHLHVREVDLRSGRTVPVVCRANGRPRVEAAGAVDAKNAPTSSLENEPRVFHSSHTP